jgi:hypothetical protein
VDRYPFLETISEPEALARGANLAERVMHGVLKTIKQHSSMENAANRNLFQLNSPIPDLQNLTKKDLIICIKKLMGEQLVCQIFLMVYNPDKHEVKPLPCFISRPPDERHTTDQLYAETNFQSILALEEMADRASDPTPDDLIREFEADLNSEKYLPPAILILFRIRS